MEVLTTIIDVKSSQAQKPYKSIAWKRTLVQFAKLKTMRDLQVRARLVVRQNTTTMKNDKVKCDAWKLTNTCMYEYSNHDGAKPKTVTKSFPVCTVKILYSRIL